jgi:predicted RNA binding protein YcfA (HicA-like mRNA interferase family)
LTPRLPSVSARELIRALERAGFQVQRQKGSHATLRHPETRRVTVVPVHAGDVKRPLLKMIIAQSGLTEDEFLLLL